jgi:predicted nucleic acid binding AN1-type Zn finger protein
MSASRCEFEQEDTECCLPRSRCPPSKRPRTMANSTASDLMSIGTHCAHDGCGQLDFLPFKCDECSKTFCLAHRSYQAHNCAKAKDKDTKIILCPLCAKSIRITSSNESAVAEAFAVHTNTDCDPSNYERVHNKKKCPVPGCKTKLTESNTYECKICGKAVCMPHRFEKDHLCTGAAVLSGLP